LILGEILLYSHPCLLQEAADIDLIRNHALLMGGGLVLRIAFEESAFFGG
jgi:hypothetical protein